jgi:hypothetical protein
MNGLGFRVALQTYLQSHHPEDKEMLEMMFLRFNMHREIAESIESHVISSACHLVIFSRPGVA